MPARLVYPKATKNRKQREASKLLSEMMLVLLLLLFYIGKIAVMSEFRKRYSVNKQWMLYLDHETSKNILPLLSFENKACKASWILSRSNLFHAFIRILS